MKIVEFAKIIGKLKRTKRTGWKIYKVPNSESVAEHSLRVAILSMILAKKFKLNQEKVLKMALVHDVGEAFVGDIVKTKGGKAVPNIEAIKQNEENAIREIFSLIDGDEFIKIYQEYEEMKSPESLFVKQIDRLEFMIQALEYEDSHPLKFPKEFSDWSSSIIKSKYLKKILNYIESQRTKK